MKTRLTILAGLLLASSAFAVGLTEPETVFYGRVINRISGQTHLVSEGTLTWRIRRANGTLVTLNTKLQPLKGGVYSYRLDVPQQVLGLDLPVSTNVVPLSAQPTTWVHDQISVDGCPAAIMAPGAGSFAVSQSTRAATIRLDLEVATPLSDLNSNGIPDWWQRRYRVTDPNADTDGDGRNNLAEFLQGSDPNRDDRTPSLETRETRVYAGGISIVRLQSIDADSAPANLIYTLRSLPDSGALYLRNAKRGGSSHDLLLRTGSSFSQADVDSGRVIFVHKDPDATASASFEITLRDENPAHAISTNRVAVFVYKPGQEVSASAITPPGAGLPMRLPQVAGVSAEEQPFVVSYLLSKELGYIVGDASGEPRNLELAVPSSALTRAQYDSQYVPDYGADRQHVLIGSFGADRIVGGMENDILVGGGGNDTLRGNGGSDLFVFCTPDDGNDIIEDFNATEGDVIDLSRLLTGSSPWVTNYVLLAAAGANSELRLSFNGAGSSYSDMTLTLAGVQMNQSTFLALVESGQIYTGGKVLTPRFTVVASQANASENGPISGEFTLTRSGSLDAARTVNLQFTGSAVNGSDYAFVSPQATFLPGERTVKVRITPYVDTLTELSEVVQIAVVTGADYEVGTSSVATVTIEDLAPQISIEALEPVAVKSRLVPGVLLVSRGGVLDRSVLVRLNIGGTASRNADYDDIPSFINFLPGQTTALISVNPKPGAILSNGVEFVEVAIRADAAYRLAEPSSARVILVNEQLTLPTWRDRFFPGVAGNLMTFAGADPGLTGIRNLQRYAFGLDPVAPQNSSGRPLFIIRDGHLTVSYRRPVSVTDVAYAVEVSEDLVTWHSGDAYVEPVNAPDFANQPEMASYRVKRTMSQDRTMFMRVRVTYQP